MANNNQCGNRRRRCGCMKMARGCWQSFPYYGGPCPDTCGCYGYHPCDEDDDNDNNSDPCGDCPRRRRRRCRAPFSAIFTALLPLAIGPNGIVPLVLNTPCRDAMFKVNAGLITLEAGGTYLATCDVRTPEGTAIDTTITLNVNDAPQPSAVTRIVTDGDGTASFSAQAIFEADEGDTVCLRTSDAINVTDPSAQPMFTLSLVRLDH